MDKFKQRKRGKSQQKEIRNFTKKNCTFPKVRSFSPFI